MDSENTTFGATPALQGMNTAQDVPSTERVGVKRPRDESTAPGVDFAGSTVAPGLTVAPVAPPVSSAPVGGVNAPSAMAVVEPNGAPSTKKPKLGEASGAYAPVAAAAAPYPSSNVTQQMSATAAMAPPQMAPQLAQTANSVPFAPRAAALPAVGQPLAPPNAAPQPMQAVAAAGETNIVMGSMAAVSQQMDSQPVDTKNGTDYVGASAGTSAPDAPKPSMPNPGPASIDGPPSMPQQTFQPTPLNERPTTRSRTVRSLDSDDPSALLTYIPGGSFPDLSFLMQRLVEVRIPAANLTTESYDVQTRQIWGTEEYTPDSDIVAMLIHMDKFPVTARAPKGIAGLSVVVRVLPGRMRYAASKRNGLRSRSWPALTQSYSLEIVRTATIPPDKADTLTLTTRRGRGAEARRKRANPTDAEILTMTPPHKNYIRFAARLKNQSLSEAVYCFTNQGDIAYGEMLPAIRDRGVRPEQWTSNRFNKEVLYFGDADGTEFELAREAPKSDGGEQRYRLSKVVDPGTSEEQSIKSNDSSIANKRKLRTRQSVAVQESKRLPRATQRAVPLTEASVSVLESGVAWNEFEWRPGRISLRGRVFSPSYIQFKAMMSL